MKYLRNISDHTARLILMHLCDKDSTIRCKANQILDKYEAAVHNASAGTKRKADEEDLLTGLMICRDCEGFFTETTRRGEAICRYHDDLLIPDEDSGYWDDHDEDCHGIIDTEEMKTEHPEGFKWQCCEKANGSEGCEHRNYHIPVEEAHKRPRLDFDQQLAVLQKPASIIVAAAAAEAPIEISSGDEEEDDDDDQPSNEE